MISKVWCWDSPSEFQALAGKQTDARYGNSLVQLADATNHWHYVTVVILQYPSYVAPLMIFLVNLSALLTVLYVVISLSRPVHKQITFEALKACKGVFTIVSADGVDIS